MADQRTVWLYIYQERHDSEGPAFLVFAKEQDAYAHAVDVIRGLAAAERTAYDWQEDDPNPDELDEILKDIAEGRLKDAVMGWEGYQEEHDHDEKVEVMSVQFFE
jgi:ABC-type nitrate/sulfonate/bicarbonate transport system substrate-binding protein